MQRDTTRSSPSTQKTSIAATEQSLSSFEQQITCDVAGTLASQPPPAAASQPSAGAASQPPAGALTSQSPPPVPPREKPAPSQALQAPQISLDAVYNALGEIERWLSTLQENLKSKQLVVNQTLLRIDVRILTDETAPIPDDYQQILKFIQVFLEIHVL